jgi:hypothetical protein
MVFFLRFLPAGVTRVKKCKKNVVLPGGKVQHSLFPSYTRGAENNKPTAPR